VARLGPDAAGEQLVAAQSPWPHSPAEAEVEDVVTAPRGYGALTREDLVEACGATHWSDHGFRRAVDRAVSSGKIRALSGELYEIANRPWRKREGEQSDD